MVAARTGRRLHAGFRERPSPRQTAHGRGPPRRVSDLHQRIGNRAAGVLLQAKLRVSAPGDRYEREADRVADQAMRMPEPMVRCAGCAGGTPCAACAGEEPVIQRMDGGGGGGFTMREAVASGLGPGRPLDRQSRSYFEPRFGRDFGNVRVHTGPAAARSARDLHARAFTVGRDVVFGAGEYAPATDQGRRLLAHELVHFVQQRSGGEPLIQRELIYASGYPRRFRTDPAEVRCYQRPDCTWFPSSVDFRATAVNSGGGTGRGTFSALLDHISARSPRAITELGLIGHANPDAFGLSGRITRDTVRFTAPGLIDAETLARERARIEGLRDRFAPDAKITLYGCNAGVGETLLDNLSRAFRVCVRGFSPDIITCLRWRTPSLEIFSRGRVYVDTEGLHAAGLVRCEDFYENVRDLTPDRESCAGVPPAPAAPAREAPAEARGPRRLGVDVRAGAALPDERWRAAVSLGARYSLRSDRLIVVNPLIGAQLLYLPPAGELEMHVAAAVAELGLRVQQPLQGVYADVRAGAYVGLEVPTGGTGVTAEPSAVGGFTAALGGGYRWERLALGAEARGLVGEGSDHFLIVGVGSLLW